MRGLIPPLPLLEVEPEDELFMKWYGEAEGGRGVYSTVWVLFPLVLLLPRSSSSSSSSSSSLMGELW